MNQPRYLKPVRILRALLRSENFDKAIILVSTNVVPVGPREVAVERRRVELRQHIDLGHIAVEAVADRDINEPVVSTQRHRRLGPLLGQWVQPCPGATTEDNPKNTLRRWMDHIS